MEKIVIKRGAEGRMSVQTEGCSGEAVTHLLELAKHQFLANNSQFTGAATKPST